MNILLFTNDHLLTDVMRIALSGTYRMRCAATERQLFTTLAPAHTSAVVLDARCGDATDLCPRLRAFSDAALIAIARTDTTAERVRLLRAGADEALGRSFELAELVARLQAKLRRLANDRPRDIRFAAAKIV
jgi:DNA-binding response OmpR family regulator